MKKVWTTKAQKICATRIKSRLAESALGILCIVVHLLRLNNVRTEKLKK